MNSIVKKIALKNFDAIRIRTLDHELHDQTYYHLDHFAQWFLTTLPFLWGVGRVQKIALKNYGVIGFRTHDLKLRNQMFNHLDRFAQYFETTFPFFCGVGRGGGLNFHNFVNPILKILNTSCNWVINFGS